MSRSRDEVGGRIAASQTVTVDALRLDQLSELRRLRRQPAVSDPTAASRAVRGARPDRAVRTPASSGGEAQEPTAAGARADGARRTGDRIGA